MMDCVSEDVWRSARKSRSHRHHPAAAGLSGPRSRMLSRASCTASTAIRPVSRRLHLGSSPCTAAELHVRTVDRSAHAAGGHHADVWQGHRRARRSQRPDHSLGDPVIVVPSVIRLHSYVRVPYRARIPMTRAALMHRDRFRCAYCGAKADTVDHVVPRSRAANIPGRTASRPVRRATTARRTGCSPSWAGRCGRCRCRRRASTGGCCPASRNSTRRGCDTWVRARLELRRAIRFAS